MITYRLSKADVYISGEHRSNRWSCEVEADSITEAYQKMVAICRKEFKASKYAKIRLIGDVYGC